MKSTRSAITLGYEVRNEVELGTFEPVLTEKKVKAEQEQIFQRRLDLAMQEGFVITARFRVRSNLIKGELKYVFWKGKKYKVNSMNEDSESHFTLIELGQLM